MKNVVLIAFPGTDFDSGLIDDFKKECAELGLDYEVIGDGKKANIANFDVLAGKINKDTQIHIWGHGVKAKADNLFIQNGENFAPANAVLSALSALSPDGICANMWSCYSGRFAPTKAGYDTILHTDTETEIMGSAVHDGIISSVRKYKIHESDSRNHAIFVESFLTSPEQKTFRFGAAEFISFGSPRVFKTIDEFNSSYESETKRFCEQTAFTPAKLPAFNIPELYKTYQRNLVYYLVANSKTHPEYLGILDSLSGDFFDNTMQENHCLKATPIYIAAQDGNTACVEILCNKGINPNIPAKDGTTPLHIAAQLGHETCVDSLSKKLGINLDATLGIGYSPLHIASQNGHVGCVRILLDAGANPGVEDTKKGIPIFDAIKQNRVDCVEEFCRRGLMNQANSSGARPVHLASAIGNLDSLMILKTYNADFDAPDSAGNTALQLATARNRVGCVAFIQSLKKPDTEVLKASADSLVAGKDVALSAPPTGRK